MRKQFYEFRAGMLTGMFALAVGCIIAALAWNRVSNEDYIMVEKQETFGGYLSKHCYEDNAIKIKYGMSHNGSKTWPCLRIEVPFQEGEEQKMVAVGKLFEALLRELGIIQELGHGDVEGNGPVEPELDPKQFEILKAHWAAGVCYSCGKFKCFGGLCNSCKGYCPGCGVGRIRGRMCDECKEKGYFVCRQCGDLLGPNASMTCTRCTKIS